MLPSNSSETARCVCARALTEDRPGHWCTVEPPAHCISQAKCLPSTPSVTVAGPYHLPPVSLAAVREPHRRQIPTVFATVVSGPSKLHVFLFPFLNPRFTTTHTRDTFGNCRDGTALASSMSGGNFSRAETPSSTDHYPEDSDDGTSDSATVPGPPMTKKRKSIKRTKRSGRKK